MLLKRSVVAIGQNLNFRFWPVILSFSGLSRPYFIARYNYCLTTVVASSDGFFLTTKAGRRFTETIQREGVKMALILRGGEFFSTEPLTVQMILGLRGLAVRRPVMLNGLEFRVRDFESLAEEVVRTGQPVQVPFREAEAS